MPLDELLDALETGDPRVRARPIKRHLEFDTRTPHLIANPTDHAAEMLAPFGPQKGERMHVRSCR